MSGMGQETEGMNMSLIIRGSAFYFGDEVSASDSSFEHFFSWIQSQDYDMPWPYHVKLGPASEIRRQLYFGSNKKYWFGIFISARTSEFQHFVKREGDTVVIEARSTGGDPPVETNFFCLRKDSGKGIFSHYKGSYPFSQFLKDLWNCYRLFVSDNKKKQLDKPKRSKPKKRIETEYSLQSKARYGPLFTPGTFEELVKRFSSIEEIRLTTFEVDVPEDQPVSGRIRNVHKVYRLDPSEKVDSTLLNWIRSLRSKSARELCTGKVAYSGSVVGVEDGDSPLCVSFQNSMDDYLAYNYDELGTFEVDKIFKHPLIQRMVEQMSSGILFDPDRT